MMLSVKIEEKEPLTNSSAVGILPKLPGVLYKHYSEKRIASYSKGYLQRLLTCLLELSREVSAKEDSMGQPKWWPQEMAYDLSVQDMTNSALAKLVVLGRDFLWSPEKSNISGENLRRKKNLRRCRERRTTRLKVLSENRFNRMPFVRLYDILRPSPIRKEHYVEQLGLMPVNCALKRTDRLLRKMPRLITMPNVPFSSDYARTIINNEKQTICPEVHLRKIENTEWYLRNDLSTADPTVKDYPITYNKTEEEYCHLYRFPVRQSYQILDKVEFLKTLCRPLEVRLEKINVSHKKIPAARRVTLNIKVLKVVLPRLKDLGSLGKISCKTRNMVK